jgi:hypothetical protein
VAGAEIPLWPERIPTVSDLASALGNGWRATNGFEAMPLLEELMRTYCHDSGRLYSVRKLLEQLGSTPEGRKMIPDEFVELWQVFETTLREGKQ